MFEIEVDHESLIAFPRLGTAGARNARCTLSMSHDVSVEADGTIRVPSFRLPLSSVASRAARESMTATLGRSPVDLPSLAGLKDEKAFVDYVERYRREIDQRFIAPLATALLDAFPVRIAAEVIAGVPVEVFTPMDGPEDETVLINLHGGAFMSGAINVGRVESIPVSNRGRFRVISVNYRQAHEHTYPAATEDVVGVYRSLLETYPPRRIGIFGGSAGAYLTAQVTAWLVAHELPVPGAVVMGGSGAGGAAGDSRYFSAVGAAQVPPDPSRAELSLTDPDGRGYLRTAAPDDYLAQPILAPPSLLAGFPPALLITATRAFDMSPAIAFHRALTRAGVDASLHVFDGLGHCFYYNAWLPEAEDAYDTLIRFFRRHLV
jgi:monoterpene epsilon-lactone hydrolase